MKIKIGFGFLGLFFSIYDTKSSRIKWLEIGFYLAFEYVEEYPLILVTSERR